MLSTDLVTALRTLCPDVKESTTPYEAWVLVSPARPKGHEFVRGSFWRVLSDSLAWRKSFKEDSAQRLARWIITKKCHEKTWPPAPVTRPFYGQPALWDGKREKGAT